MVLNSANSVFCPKAFAGIGRKLPDTVRTRSIPIEMRKRIPSKEPVESFRSCKKQAEGLGLRLAAAVQCSSFLTLALDAFPGELDDDRARDIWEPLLSIASMAGGDCLDRAKKASVKLSGSGNADESSFGGRLLGDIRSCFERDGAERLATRELLSRLADMDEAPWGDHRNGKPLDARGLSQLLRSYGVARETLRFGGETAKGHSLASFEDAFSRYLLCSTNFIGNTVTNGHFEPENGRNGSVTYSAPEKGSVTRNVALFEPETSECYRVTDKNDEAQEEAVIDEMIL